MLLLCPHCHARLELPATDASRPTRKLLCPKCKQVFQVADGVAAAADAPTRPSRAPAPPRAVPPVVATGANPRPQPPSQPVVEDDPFARFSDTIAGAIDAPQAPTQWEIRRSEYEGHELPFTEVEDLIKRAWLNKSDEIREAGTSDWIAISAYPPLGAALAIRDKTIKQKLSAVARRSSHTCENHIRKAAVYVCFECARTFCADCRNSTDLGEQAVSLCLDCDAPMSPV